MSLTPPEFYLKRENYISEVCCENAHVRYSGCNSIASFGDLTKIGLILYDVNSALEAEEGAASESI